MSLDGLHTGLAVHTIHSDPHCWLHIESYRLELQDDFFGCDNWGIIVNFGQAAGWGQAGSEDSIEARDSALDGVDLVLGGESQELKSRSAGSCRWRVEFTLTPVLVGQVVKAVFLSVKAIFLER